MKTTIKPLEYFLLHLMRGLGIIAVLVLVGNTHAAKEKRKSTVQTRKNQAKLGTNFRFDGMSLNGKFQSAPWTSTTVEDDKFLDDLLTARTNFRDRVQKDLERN